MFAITSYPTTLNLTGQPLLFTVESDRVFKSYKILALPFPGDPSLGCEVKSRDEESRAIFNLSEFFIAERSSEYSFQPAALHSEMCKESTVVFQEYYGNPPVGSGDISWNGYIIAGNIPQWKYYSFINEYSSFNQYIGLTKAFLTFYPRHAKKILKSQPERLYHLNLSSQTKTIGIRIGILLDDESIAEYIPLTSIEANPYQVVSFATGYNQLNLEAWRKANYPSSQIQSYYVECIVDGLSVSEKFHYEIDNENYRNVKYLIFKNSLFGYDTLKCTGEFDEIVDIERSVANRVADVYNQGRLSKMEYRNKTTDSVKLNTGWLTNDEKNWINELLTSEEIYEYNNNDQLIRILMKTKQFDKTARVFEPGAVELEYERLFLAE